MRQITHSKPAAFFPLFERKGEDIETTHYCPGCGHGVLHKLIAEAIVDLGIQDRTILVSPVGCAVFAYHYLDVGNVQASHGRAPAVATGIKRARPQSVVLCYQGDGDLAAIGGNEILHAANRGEQITVFFVNNGIYGMTGGQMAPTTPLGARTVTSPAGRSANSDGYPLRMCELLATLEAPAYIERVALTDARQHMRARKAVRCAIQNQIDRRGFSFVELLAACPTGWKLAPRESIGWIEKNMMPIFPLGVYRDRPRMSEETLLSQEPCSPDTLFAATETAELPLATHASTDAAIKISGLGGQGVLFSGLTLAQAGIREGLRVTWIPSYGPEMRGGAAHCHVRLSNEKISSPLIDHPSVVIALNQASAERFAPELVPGGLLLLNSSLVKTIPERTDIKVIYIPATEAATDLGNPQVANTIMLGAYLQETGPLRWESVMTALREHIISPGVLRTNRIALQVGRALASSAGQHLYERKAEDAA